MSARQVPHLPMHRAELFSASALLRDCAALGRIKPNPVLMILQAAPPKQAKGARGE